MSATQSSETDKFTQLKQHTERVRNSLRKLIFYNLSDVWLKKSVQLEDVKNAWYTFDEHIESAPTSETHDAVKDSLAYLGTVALSNPDLDIKGSDRLVTAKATELMTATFSPSPDAVSSNATNFVTAARARLGVSTPVEVKNIMVSLQKDPPPTIKMLDSLVNELQKTAEKIPAPPEDDDDEYEELRVDVEMTQRCLDAMRLVRMRFSQASTSNGPVQAETERDSTHTRSW
ncbi:hypothetical protein Q5752_000542 [Cryptotrichosporon argae]